MAMVVDEQHTEYSTKTRVVASVPPGEEIILHARRDAFRRMAEGEAFGLASMDEYNILTGPVSIQGARAGQWLKVDILDVEITECWGFAHPEFGTFAPHFEDAEIRSLPVLDGRIQISERLSIPLMPMVGAIGTTPAKGRVTGIGAPKGTGGNMDLPQVRAGASIYLPVEVDGGGLSVGDLHAAMGEGEALGVAIEAAGVVRLRATIVDEPLRAMRVEYGNTVSFIARQQAALQEAFRFLRAERGLTAFEAHTYLAGVGHFRYAGPGLFGQLVLELPLDPLADIPTPAPELAQAINDRCERLARPKPRTKEEILESLGGFSTYGVGDLGGTLFTGYGTSERRRRPSKSPERPSRPTRSYLDTAHGPELWEHEPDDPFIDEEGLLGEGEDLDEEELEGFDSLESLAEIEEEEAALLDDLESDYDLWREERWDSDIPEPPHGMGEWGDPFGS